MPCPSDLTIQVCAFMISLISHWIEEVDQMQFENPCRDGGPTPLSFCTVLPLLSAFASLNLAAHSPALQPATLCFWNPLMAPFPLSSRGTREPSVHHP